MSVIKEIYDVAKDSAALATKAAALKRALKAELKLNQKLLADIQNAAPASASILLVQYYYKYERALASRSAKSPDFEKNKHKFKN